MVSRVNNSAFFADAEDPRYQTGNLWELPMQEDNPLMAHPGGMAQNGPMISNPLAAPPPQQQGGGFMPNAPQQAVPGQPPPQPGGMNAAMDSPYAQMAGAGLQNIVNTSLGQYGSQVSPIQAYQQAVQQRAVLNQREQTLKQAQSAEKRAQEKFEIDKDPGYEYNKLVEQGLIDPAKTSFTDYQRMGLAGRESSVERNYAQWLAVNPNASDEDKKAALENIIRAPITYQTGAGATSVTSGVQPGGPGTQLTTPNQMIDAESNLAGAKEGATQGEQTKANQVNTGLERAWAAREAYNTADSVLNSSKEFLAQLESGEVDTGFIDGFLLNTFGYGSEELAALNNETIMQGLMNLGITNLAPVTEQEFANVLKLWADIGMQPTPNIGSVKRAIARTERLQRRIQNDALSAANQVKEYGGDSAYGSLLNANDFVRGVVAPPEAGGSKQKWTRDADGNLVKVE